MSIWERQEWIVGSDGQQKLAESVVLVAGIGANGSIVAEALTRVGVGHLILADPDRVEESNLNRQNYVTSDIGVLKVEALMKRLHAINPSVKIDNIPAGVQLENTRTTVESANVVIDCCDDYAAKVLLSRWCKRLNKPSIHSAGGVVRGAVTVFDDLDTYESLFELPSQSIPDESLWQIDYRSHRKRVIERFGAGFFDSKMARTLSESANTPWPTIVGACDIAGHLSALQAVWIVLGWEEYLIRAPEILIFDVSRAYFQRRDYSDPSSRVFVPK